MIRKIILILTFSSLLVAMFGLTIIPYNNDLYSLLYSNFKPKISQNTYFFLLMFPVLQVVAVVLMEYKYKSDLSSDNPSSIILLHLHIIFLLCTIFRFFMAFEFYY